MKLNTFIHELLLENETVIIPGFGAFISNYKPAEINTEEDKIIPPSKELLFNPKIRNNDGILVGYIAEKEGISHFDALKKIEKERENFLYKLDKGEKITFKNIGILFRDDNNIIAFESFQEENLLLDSFGLEATSLTEPTPKIVEENKEEHEILVSDNIAEITDRESEKPEETSKETNAPDEKPVLNLTEHTVFIPDEKDKNKKRSWYWLLLIFIPIIFAGIFILKTEKQDFPPGLYNEQETTSNSQITSSTNILSLDSAQSDTTNKEINSASQNDTIVSEAEEKTLIAEHGNFYLVGGSFKAEENAEKFMQEFNAQGYEPFLLGKRGNFYIVAIGRFNTEAAAISAQKEFLIKNPNSGTWIYEDDFK